MKKLAALSILFALLTAAAFAQFKAEVVVDFEGDILRTAAPMDQAKDTSKDDPFQGYPSAPGNEGKAPAIDPSTGNLTPVGSGSTSGAAAAAAGYRGYEKRYFNFMSSADFWAATEVKINLSYNDPSDKDDPKYHGELQILATPVLQKLALGMSTSLQDFLDSSFGDWNAWGKVGILKGFIGNTGDTGATGNGRGLNYAVKDPETGKVSYTDFSASYMKNKFEGLGIMKMATLPFYVYGGSGLVPPVGPRTYYYYQAAPGARPVYADVEVSNLKPVTGGTYVAVEADLSPVKVAVAGDITAAAQFVAIDGLTDYDSHTSIGAAFRVSADLLDMLKLDAIYKVTGREKTTDENQGITNAIPFVPPKLNAQPNDDGRWTHRFGLFGNVNLLNDTLGVTLGYSGEIIAQENTGDAASGNGFAAPTSPTGKKDTSYLNPYYSGIDLRATFNGLDKLHLAFNNNISFAYIKGAKPSTYTRVNGITGLALDDPEKSDGYFGMYNALLVDFNLTDALLLSFQAGNRWYSTTHTDKTRNNASTPTSPAAPDNPIPARKEKDVIVNMDADELNISVGAAYSLTSHVTLGTGLAFNIYHQTWKQTDYEDVKAGLFTFGIPLKVKVVY